MKPLLGLLLALGALIGLFGQEAAYARSVTQVPVASRSAQADRDCMAAMRSHSKPASVACQGNDLDCIAAMGCTIPLALTEEQRLQDRARKAPPTEFWSRARPLVGIEIAPERLPPLTFE